jgi:hypothetical protein
VETGDPGARPTGRFLFFWCFPPLTGTLASSLFLSILTSSLFLPPAGLSFRYAKKLA